MRLMQGGSRGSLRCRWATAASRSAWLRSVRRTAGAVGAGLIRPARGRFAGRSFAGFIASASSVVPNAEFGDAWKDNVRVSKRTN